LFGFCRAKLLILYVFNTLYRTLDQHIGVRIPGGQPIPFTRFRGTCLAPAGRDRNRPRIYLLFTPLPLTA
jgi:hypothetical protein